jgi:hypothetical protein
MNKLLGTFALLAAIAVPCFGQSYARLSSNDQREFDKYYTKWVNDTRKNDTDDIAKDVRQMQEIMIRNNIPATAPFEQIASTGAGYPSPTYQGRLSAHDQQEFDKYYTKWVHDTRKNDKDDIAKDVRHMQEIMARNNIPLNVPFDRVASAGYAGSSYPAAAYPTNGPWQGRLSAADQRAFDTYYAAWVEDMRRNDQVGISRDAGDMQEIMARSGIPANVPFDQIASSGAYPATGASNVPWQRRLSPDDQRDFDKYYLRWLDDTGRNDRDDIAKDVGYMQEIMARNNIPAAVPFDQIASPGIALQH